MIDRTHVKIGEIRVVQNAGVLYTIGLGSCVAVVLYDPREKIGGLAHVMLPEPTNNRAAAPGRFAPTAVDALVEMLIKQGARKRGMFARIAGGASMFADVVPAEGLSLGARNVSAVKNALAKSSIPLRAEDCGGSYGRSVFFDAADGKLLIRAVRRDDIVL